MSLKPLFARVLLKRDIPDKIGALVVPEQYAKRNASLMCKVIAVGPTADKSIESGMTVLVGQHAGAWLDENGASVPSGDYFIAMDEDILCEVVDDRRSASRAA